MEIQNILRAIVLKRPSATCKSPYVADIRIDGQDDVVLAHAPSLGCSGIVDKGGIVYVQPKHHNGTRRGICDYTIYLGENNGVIVGVHPKIAEKLAYHALLNNEIFTLKHLRSITAEVCIGDSRFDFVCFDKNNIKTIIEVKNVPLVESVVMNDDECYASYFPDGYRKKKSEPVSPRALKHINALKDMKIQSNTGTDESIRCVTLFIIQRTDSILFKSGDKDLFYKEALKDAFDNGVEILPCQFEWSINNNVAICRFCNMVVYCHEL